MHYNAEDHAIVWYSAPCGPCADHSQAIQASVHSYDTDTMDALMLFYSPSATAAPYSLSTASVRAPYQQFHAAALQSRQQALARERAEATRRAVHRDVQRRFVKRKREEFANLRSRARSMELRYRTLLLLAESDTLREERERLLRRCEDLDIAVEGQDQDKEQDDNLGEEEQDGSGANEAGGPGAALPRKLFEFDLSSADAVIQAE